MGLSQLCGYITFQLPLRLCACLDDVMCHGRFLSRLPVRKLAVLVPFFSSRWWLWGAGWDRGRCYKKQGGGRTCLLVGWQAQSSLRAFLCRCLGASSRSHAFLLYSGKEVLSCDITAPLTRLAVFCTYAFSIRQCQPALE